MYETELEKLIIQLNVRDIMIDFSMISKVPISVTLWSYWNCLVREVGSNFVVLSQKALSTF